MGGCFVSVCVCPTSQLWIFIMHAWYLDFRLLRLWPYFTALLRCVGRSACVVVVVVVVVLLHHLTIEKSLVCDQVGKKTNIAKL